MANLKSFNAQVNRAYKLSPDFQVLQSPAIITARTYWGDRRNPLAREVVRASLLYLRIIRIGYMDGLTGTLDKLPEGFPPHFLAPYQRAYETGCAIYARMMLDKIGQQARQTHAGPGTIQ